MPNPCVILTPVASSIEAPCEDGLRELERRGYTVWRVRGHSAIDMGRCKMASDALRSGFSETLWIDSDIGFEPADVERIRNHNLPITCGIYPKKGRRELAVHLYPHTDRLLFGKNAPLTEVRYCAAGFLHVRREVYEAMIKRLSLPLCHEHSPNPFYPFFMPFLINEPAEPRDPEGKPYTWYLGEDFAFCERARQCGYKIMADTSIRLYHFGSYGFSWEDAGNDVPRFPSYDMIIDDSQARLNPTPTKPQDPTQPSFMSLQGTHPWPAAKPVVPGRTDAYIHPATLQWIDVTLSPNAKLILELGAENGSSTKALALLNSELKVVSACVASNQLLHRIAAHIWEVRDRVVAMETPLSTTVRELQALDLHPDLVFVSPIGGERLTPDELTLMFEAFPNTKIVVDGWHLPQVRNHLARLCSALSLRLDSNPTACRISRSL